MCGHVILQTKLKSRRTHDAIQVVKLHLILTLKSKEWWSKLTEGFRRVLRCAQTALCPTQDATDWNHLPRSIVLIVSGEREAIVHDAFSNQIGLTLDATATRDLTCLLVHFT